MPGLLTFYDIRPGNGEGLFLFRHFINLSLTYLLTALDPHGASGCVEQSVGNKIKINDL